ncbi:hypothetical protein NG796_14700 [Laspinema sp. A4]|nr:hypothetical protein [Laspinema sp. D2d]
MELKQPQIATELPRQGRWSDGVTGGRYSGGEQFLRRRSPNPDHRYLRDRNPNKTINLLQNSGLIPPNSP